MRNKLILLSGQLVEGNDETQIGAHTLTLPLHQQQSSVERHAEGLHQVRNDNGWGAADALPAVHQNFAVSGVGVLNEGNTFPEIAPDVLVRMIANTYLVDSK